MILNWNYQRLKWNFGLVRNCSLRALLLLAYQKKKKRSVLFFSQHKAASTFLAKIISQVARVDQGFKHINYPSLIGDLGCHFSFGDRFPSECDWYYQNSEILFNKNGFLYGPHRWPFLFEGIPLFKKVIFLRDPRDSLISRYYSFGFTHRVPHDKQTQKNFLDERREIENMTIDEYCIEMAHQWSKPLLSGYIQLMESSIETPLLLLYEDYVHDPKSIINRILEYCELPNHDSVSRSLAEEARPVSHSINPSSHKRSGRPGQFHYELSDRTVKEIGNILKYEIEYFRWNEIISKTKN